MLRRFMVIVAGAVLAGGALAAREETPKAAAPRAAHPADGPRDREPKGPDPSLSDQSTKKAHASIKPLTPEQEKETLTYAKEKRPDYYEWLAQYREADPRRYQYLVRALWNVIEKGRRLPPEVREAQEKLYQANQVRLWRLARDILKATDPAAKARLETELQEVMTLRFEAEQVIRGDRLKQLADEIKRLKAELDERARNRDAVILERIERLKKEAVRRTGPRATKGADKDGPTTRPGRDRKGLVGPKGESPEADGDEG